MTVLFEGAAKAIGAFGCLALWVLVLTLRSDDASPPAASVD